MQHAIRLRGKREILPRLPYAGLMYLHRRPYYLTTRDCLVTAQRLPFAAGEPEQVQYRRFSS